MTIAEADCFTYSLPLAAPLSLETESIDSREGVLVRLRDDEGNEGWGEAAPLPGFSSETLDEATNDLQNRARDLVGLQLATSGEGIFDTVPRCSLPSVEFAIESAVSRLYAATGDRSLSTMFGEGHDTVRVNAFVPDLRSTVGDVVRQILDQGYEAVKVKVGRHDLEWEADRIRDLSQDFGSDVDIRLDANRAWSFDEACTFFERLGPVSIDYIEEPLQALDQLSRFVRVTGRPVALDETTREIAPEDVLVWDDVAAIVLKPTLLGGIRTVRRWTVVARRSGARPIFSGSYESGVGMQMLVGLASAFSDFPSGFGTYKRLDRDIVTPRLPLDGPTASVQEVMASTPDPSRIFGLGE